MAEEEEPVLPANESKSDDKLIEINYKDIDRAHFPTFKSRQVAWQDSLKNSDRFWGNFAKKNIDWSAPFDTVQAGTFEKGDIAWFLNGKLNVCFNCVDRWVKYKPDATAIIWEGNDPTDTQRITYKELQEEVCKIANVLRRYGVRRGDVVVIYMPMIPQAAYAMLACARIGAPHSVIFGGFGRDAIRDRILDANARFVITANEGLRGKKAVPLKQTVDQGLKECPDVEAVFVWMRTDTKVPMLAGRDHILNELVARERPYAPCEVMDSEDTLFLLYTSGSTGRPKGVLHTNAGYLVYTMATHRYVFDIQPGDVYACVADIGWITGHSYIVYGPLANGSTTFMFESVPTYPDAGRYWDMVQRHKISVFYTAPTAIRALMKFGDQYVTKYDRSSLKVLGSVGEPINPEPWLWYYRVVGNSQCPIVDTYWQTETGGIVLTPFPGATELKPGSTTFPFFGIQPALLDKQTGQEIEPFAENTEDDKDKQNENETETKDGDEEEKKMQSGILVIKRPWPGIARTVYGDHERYLETYMKHYPGYFETGDGAKRDSDGYYWITGRVDDVITVSGHRIGSGEIENVVVEHPDIAEAAVVAIPHDIKYQAIFVYAIATEKAEINNELKLAIRENIRDKLGKIFTPEYILVVKAVPKTRSGKIMRRILRKVACKDFSNLGDVTTLANPDVVQQLIDERKALPQKHLSALKYPDRAPTHNLCIVNLQKTDCDDLCAVRIFAKIDDVMIGLMEELDITIPQWMLRRFVKIKLANICAEADGNQFMELVVCGVDSDGIDATIFTAVHLKCNGQKISAQTQSVINAKENRFRPDEYVFNIKKQVLGLEIEENESKNNELEGLVLELGFYGHYNEPNVLISLNEYLQDLVGGYIVLKIEMNPVRKVWNVGNRMEQLHDVSVHKLWSMYEEKVIK